MQKRKMLKLKMQKQIILMVALILVAVTLFGCTPASDTAGSASPNTSSDAAATHSKTFNVVTSDALVQIDAHNITGPADYYVQKMCYECLVDTDHYGNYTGVLATSWEFNEDCTELTFHLREGVKFSNGEAFNADCALYNIQRLIDHRDEFAVIVNYFQPLIGGEKIDDSTVKMIFSEPFPLALSNMHMFVMIPMEAHKELGDQMFTDMKQIGTGPWIFDQWVSGQYAHLTKNPDYWNKAEYDPYFDDGYVRFVSEPSSAAATQISGDADAYISMGGIGYDVLALYQGTEDKVEIVEKTDMNAYADLRLGFPDGSPLYDEKVREAIDLAIDRQTLADQILMSGGVPTCALVPGVVGYDESIKPYEYNPEKAKELLAQSSYDGRELKLLSMSIGIKAEDYALAIASMLEDVGFKVKTNVLDLATFNNEKDKGDWDLMPASNLMLDGNPGGFFNSRFIQDYMHAGFKGDEANELIDLCKQFNILTDPSAREDIAKQINNWMKDFHGPELAVAKINAVWAQNYGVKGIVMYPDTFFSLTRIDWDPSLVK